MTFLEMDYLARGLPSPNWSAVMSYPKHHVPQLDYPSDSGVFAIMYADCVSSEREFKFSNENVHVIRQNFIMNILNSRWWN